MDKVGTSDVRPASSPDASMKKQMIFASEETGSAGITHRSRLRYHMKPRPKGIVRELIEERLLGKLRSTLGGEGKDRFCIECDKVELLLWLGVITA